MPALLFAGIDWSTVDLDNPEHFAPGQITVRFADGVNLANIQSALSAQEATLVSRIEQLNAVHLRLPKGKDVLEAIQYYEAIPDVLYAEPVMIRRAFWTPNDEYYYLQWHFHNINMPDAWNAEQGSSGVIIAIVDTGIAFEDYDIPSHESGEVTSSDGRYHRAPDFDVNRFVPGYDFVHEDAHPNDQQGHGTHVAGTVAQATDNSIGTAGMAPYCRLMPVQVLGYDGSGYDTWIAAGITWAANNGAHVINLSLGSKPGTPPSQVEHDAIKYADTKGVVVVAAAGNWEEAEISYPARFEECIAVAALDYNNELSYYSQYGDGLDISAPGGDMTADENNDTNGDGVLQCTYEQGYDPQYGTLAAVDAFNYQFFQGTSMATPHVAGLAALLISHGITGVGNVKAAIYSTATYLGSSFYYGNGMINPVEALDYGGSDVIVQIPVLQNPLLSQHADIWVVPTFGDLYSAPSVTVDGEPITMTSVPGSQAYVGDYEFTTTGTVTINVSGSATASRTFTVEDITAAGGMIASADGRCYIEVPAGAVRIPAYFTLIEDKTSPSSSANPYEIHCNKDARAFGPVYRAGPSGIYLCTPVSLHIGYTDSELRGTDASTLVLTRYENGNWTRVPSFIDRERGEVVATIQRLGIFQLASDVNQRTPDLPQAVDLTLLTANPLPGEGVARLSLTEETSLSLAVFDASGRKVMTVLEGTYPSGAYDLTWQNEDNTGRRLSPGVYFLHLTTPSLSRNLKIISLH